MCGCGYLEESSSLRYRGRVALADELRYFKGRTTVFFTRSYFVSKAEYRLETLCVRAPCRVTTLDGISSVFFGLSSTRMRPS